MSAEQELREWIENERASRAPQTTVGPGWERLKKAVDSGDAPLAVPVSLAHVSQSTVLAGRALVAVLAGAIGTTAFVVSSKSPPDSTSAIPALRRAPIPNVEAAPTPAAPAPAPVAPAERDSSATLTPEQPTAQVLPQSRPRSGAPVAIPTEHQAASSLNEELRLITNAKRDLDRGAARSATAWLNEHRTRFPSGSLSAERDALKLLLLCNGPKAGVAVSQVEAFARRYPGSPLLDRIRRACLVEPASTRALEEREEPSEKPGAKPTKPSEEPE